MKSFSFVVILALAIAAGACSGTPASLTSPTPVSSFTLTRLIVGIPDGGATETGTPVNGGTVPSGTMLKYTAYYNGPQGAAYTITFVTKRGNELVDSQSFSGTKSSTGETGSTGVYRPSSSGTYTVEASITSAPAPVSATFEAR